MKTKENKIYRINLILNDTIAKYEDESICVFTTKNEQEAKHVYEKLSENKNLKYVLK